MSATWIILQMKIRAPFSSGGVFRWSLQRGHPVLMYAAWWMTSERCSSAEGNGIIMGWYPNITTLALEWILIITIHMLYSTENIKWCHFNVTSFAGLSVWWAGSPVQYCAHKKPQYVNSPLWQRHYSSPRPIFIGL